MEVSETCIHYPGTPWIFWEPDVPNMLKEPVSFPFPDPGTMQGDELSLIISLHSMLKDNRDK